MTDQRGKIINYQLFNLIDTTWVVNKIKGGDKIALHL